ncbi:MAG: hypothetical protein LBH01_02185 [Verrucomicrobiales bacterium]|jgi:hypothetical protein|nr:hypothetical protein [Verrucomicrobiales bacterium]
MNIKEQNVTAASNRRNYIKGCGVIFPITLCLFSVFYHPSDSEAYYGGEVISCNPCGAHCATVDSSPTTSGSPTPTGREMLKEEGEDIEIVDCYIMTFPGYGEGSGPILVGNEEVGSPTEWFGYPGVRYRRVDTYEVEYKQDYIFVRMCETSDPNCPCSNEGSYPCNKTICTGATTPRSVWLTECRVVESV